MCKGIAEWLAITLTAGVDNIVGTAGNDTINALTTNDATTLTALDKIDGGAGNDTLNIVDTLGGIDLSVATVKNVENAVITSTGALAGNAADVSGWTGLTSATFVLKDGGTAQAITAAANTTLAVTNSGTNGVTIIGGGGASTITTKGGAVNVGQTAVANGFTSVTVAGTSSTVAIKDESGTDSSGNPVVGSSLTTVSVTGNTGLATLTGKGINNVTLAKSAGGATIVNAATGAQALTLTTNGLTAGTITDDTATSVVLNNVTAASALTGLRVNADTSLTVGGDHAINLGAITAPKLQTVVLNGSGAVTANVSTDGGTTTLGYVTSVDASASTGANVITVGDNTAFTGGSGNTTLNIGANVNAIKLGAGNDTVVLSTAALGTNGSLDAGAGTDTLQLSNANAAIAASAAGTLNAHISGFEVLSITDTALTANTTLELGYLSNLNSNVKLGAFSGAFTETINNLANGGTVELAGNNTATSITVGVKDASFGTNDSITLKLTADNAVLAGGAVSTAGVENVNIVTNNTNAAPTAQLDTLSLTDTAAKTITVSGNAGLDLSGATTGTAVTKIDASGITLGDFKVTTGALTNAATIIGDSAGANTIDASLATKAVTITVGGSANTSANVLKGGLAADVIVGGSGNDTITSGGGLDVLTGGAGADKFIITDASGTANAGAQVQITDYTAAASGGDTLSFSGAAAAGAYTGVVGAGWTDTSGILTKAGASATDFMAMIQANFVTADADKVAAFSDGTNTYVAAVDHAGTAVTFVELVGVTGLTSVSTTAGAHVLLVG